MTQNKKQIIQDLIIVLVSIVIAVILTQTGLIHKLVYSLEGMKYLGVVFAGIFFTSFFTTAPSIVVLGTFAETVSLPVLAILGGLGAVIGDYIIFRFIRDRISIDLKYLLSFSRKNRFFAIFRTRLFIFFLPFIGALIIASPLPDEIGVTMLGTSRINDKIFFLLSFILNGVGIYVIGLIAQTIVL